MLKKPAKRAKKGPKMLILGYFDIFDIFGPFLLNLNQKKNSKFKKTFLENLKNWGTNADFSQFFTQNECPGKNGHSILKPLLCLKFL